MISIIKTKAPISTKRLSELEVRKDKDKQLLHRNVGFENH